MPSPEEKTSNTPLTFDLATQDHKRLSQLAKRFKARSVSTLVRHAVEVYDFKDFTGKQRDHRQLSVRLPERLRTQLSRTAKRKKVSVGELVRAAITGYLEDPRPPSAK